VEKLNRDGIEFQLKKNGEVVQHGNTKDMISTFEQLIVHVSQYFKLLQGDLIFTGTPAGVAPVQIGDRLEGFLFTKEGKAEQAFECQVK